MDKQTYLQIKNELSFDRPLIATILVIFVDIGIFALAIHLTSLQHTSAYVASQVLFAIFFFHNFGILHEAGHNNVHQKRWINSVIGHYASIFCFLPYFPWKYIHTEHHAYTGNIDKDPTMKALKKLREKNKIPSLLSFGWRSWVPLAGLTQHFVFWFYPLTMSKQGKMDKEAFWKSTFSVLFLIGSYITLFTLLPQYFNLHNFWLSLIIYLVIVELVNLPHHSDMPSFNNESQVKKLSAWEQHQTTRSCHYPFYLSEILTLNFNYHTEHHYYPSLPWWRLRKARKLLKPAVGENYSECIGIGWNVKNRKRPAREIFLGNKTL